MSGLNEDLLLCVISYFSLAEVVELGFIVQLIDTLEFAVEFAFTVDCDPITTQARLQM